MRRTQVQLDEGLYESLRRRAFERQKSISAVVREALTEAFGKGAPPAAGHVLRDFAFVAAASSRQGRLAPVSERHDEAFTEAISGLSRPRRAKKRR